MAAGLGFKTFTTGEVLTAADTNGYLMQGVLVFASSAARAAAITSPQEGQYSFLKDTDALEYYSGSAWVGAPVGDITGVTAGTGITGGGTSGTVTVTNDMATTITTAGDLIKGTGSGTYNRLGIGSASQVLTVVSGAPAWATPAVSASGLTKISQTTFTTVASVSVNGCFTATYTNYIVVIDNLKPASNASNVLLQFQYSTSTVQTTGYTSGASYMTGGGVSGNYNVNNGASSIIGNFTDLPAGNVTINISGVGASSQRAFFNGLSNGGNSQGTVVFGGLVDANQTYTGIKLTTAAATMSGSVTVYGLAI